MWEGPGMVIFEGDATRGLYMPCQTDLFRKFIDLDDGGRVGN